MKQRRWVNEGHHGRGRVKRTSSELYHQTEDEFLAAIIELAELFGWRAYHVSNVSGKLKNRTAIGFPDLVLARAGEVIFAELKVEGNELSLEQAEWQCALAGANVCADSSDVYVWRPSDWPRIERRLSRRKPTSHAN